MTHFDQTRLTNETFQLDINGLRRGLYTDKYFQNIVTMLNGVGQAGGYQGNNPRALPANVQGLNIAEMPVEMQFFTRHRGETVVAGIDQALTMLRYGTGYWADNGEWQETWQALKVEAIHDGDVSKYAGNAMEVQPVIRVQGRYRDFAALETPMLGVLSRASRLATNVYEVLQAARGKPVLFFPARFDLLETQALDGYAYWLAVQKYNHDLKQRFEHSAESSHTSPTNTSQSCHSERSEESLPFLTPSVSTDAQGAWWGGKGTGTLAHAAIACFLGDTPATILAFAEHCPPNIPRIALVDFNNHSVQTATASAHALFLRYREAVKTGDTLNQQKYTLFGVRLDTSGNMRDQSIPPLGDPQLDFGVNPRLVMAVREGLNRAWESWELPASDHPLAEHYCQNIKIVVTGGFTSEKITLFEKLGIPADIYGVGSSLLRNDKASNTDFTADIVRVHIANQWHDLAKIGRTRCHHPHLQPTSLQNF